MPNLSIWSGIGHLGRDAELKVAGGTPVAEFSLAVTTKRKSGDSTAWYRCSLFGQRAERLAPHLTKGKAVFVMGELVPREYKGRQDELRTSLDVNVQTVQFLGGGRADGGGAGGSGSNSAPVSMEEAQRILDEPADDLPF